MFLLTLAYLFSFLASSHLASSVLICSHLFSFFLWRCYPTFISLLLLSHLFSFSSSLSEILSKTLLIFFSSLLLVSSVLNYFVWSLLILPLLSLFISIYLFSSFLVSSFLTTFLLILVSFLFVSSFLFPLWFSCFTASLLISSGLLLSYVLTFSLSLSFSIFLWNVIQYLFLYSLCLFSPHLNVLFLPRLMFSHLSFSSCLSSLFILTRLFSYFLALSFPCLFSPFLVQSHLLLWSVYNNTTTLLNHFPVTTDVFEVSLILLVIIYLMWDALLEQTVVLLFFYPSFDASRSLLLTCLPSISVLCSICALLSYSLCLSSHISLFIVILPFLCSLFPSICRLAGQAGERSEGSPLGERLSGKQQKDLKISLVFSLF